MRDIRSKAVLLEATDLEFENQAVLNPTIYQEGGTLHMFYSAARQGSIYYRINKKL